MRYTDFTKPQNKRISSLLEHADKQAGSSAARSGSLGNAHGETGASVSDGIGAAFDYSDKQKREAFLVDKLPSDFPIDGWEDMNTKAQLRAMRFSGLNDQEQWELLNSTTILNSLAAYNEEKANSIMNAVHSSAARNAGAFGANFDKEKMLLNLRNSSKSPSLQEKDSDAKMKNADIVAQLAAKILGRDLPTSTPNPIATPLPQTGPTPIATPSVGNDSNPVGKSTPIDFSSRDKQVLSSMLGMDRSLLSVSDRKEVEFIERQIQRGVTTPVQLGRFYADLLSIRARATELEWVDDRKSESEKLTFSPGEPNKFTRAGLSGTFLIT